MRKLLKRLTKSCGYRIERIPHFANTEERVDYYAQKDFGGASFLHGMLYLCLQSKLVKDEKILILQVGANDGVSCDLVFPLAKKYRNDTRLVLFEPLPDVADRLKANYAFHDDCRVVKKAISSDDKITLYRISNRVERYYHGAMASGITSFSEEYVEKKIKQNLPSHIRLGVSFPLVEQVEVDCTGISAAIDRYFRTGKVDWLQIDVEGMEEEVLSTLNISIHQPALISYEISHLTNDTRRRISSRLGSVGYRLENWSKSDCVAVHPRLWRGLDSGSE